MGRINSGMVVLAAALTLGGCSGDNDAPSEEPTQATESQIASLRPGECKIDARVTGDVRADLAGKGEFNGAVSESQPSIYRFALAKDDVVVYSAGGGIVESVTFSLRGENFSTGEEGDFAVSSDGEGASFNAPARSATGIEVQIRGEVDCRAGSTKGAGRGTKNEKRDSGKKD